MIDAVPLTAAESFPADVSDGHFTFTSTTNLNGGRSCLSGDAIAKHLYEGLAVVSAYSGNNHLPSLRSGTYHTQTIHTFGTGDALAKMGFKGAEAFPERDRTNMQYFIRWDTPANCTDPGRIEVTNVNSAVSFNATVLFTTHCVGTYTASLGLRDVSSPRTKYKIPISTLLDETIVKTWEIRSVVAPVLATDPERGWDPRSNDVLNDAGSNYLSRYAKSRTYSLAAPPPSGSLLNNSLLINIRGAVTYSFAVEPSDAVPGNFAVYGSGAMLAQLTNTGKYVGRLLAHDASPNPLVVFEWDFQVLPVDTDVAAYGPNGKMCASGAVTDAVEFDGVFACNCTEFYTGDNCETSALANQDDDLEQSQLVGYALGCTLGALLLIGTLLWVSVSYKKYKKAHTPGTNPTPLAHCISTCLRPSFFF